MAAADFCWDIVDAGGCGWVGWGVGTEDKKEEAKPVTADVNGLAIEKKEVAEGAGCGWVCGSLGGWVTA